MNDKIKRRTSNFQFNQNKICVTYFFVATFDKKILNVMYFYSDEETAETSS